MPLFFETFDDIDDADNIDEPRTEGRRRRVRAESGAPRDEPIAPGGSFAFGGVRRFRRFRRFIEGRGAGKHSRRFGRSTKGQQDPRTAVCAPSIRRQTGRDLSSFRPFVLLSTGRALGESAPAARPIAFRHFGFPGFRIFAPGCRRAAKPRLFGISRKPGLRRRTPPHEIPERNPAKGGANAPPTEKPKSRRQPRTAKPARPRAGGPGLRGGTSRPSSGCRTCGRRRSCRRRGCPRWRGGRWRR